MLFWPNFINNITSKRDTEFDDKEKAVLDEVSAGLDITDGDREVLEQSVKTIYDTYRKIGEVLDV